MEMLIELDDPENAGKSEGEEEEHDSSVQEEVMERMEKETKNESEYSKDPLEEGEKQTEEEQNQPSKEK